MKAVKSTFVDFVDAEDLGEESEEEDNVGLRTWPFLDLRVTSKESTSTRATSKESTATSEEETGAARTHVDEDVNSDAVELEMRPSEQNAAREANCSPPCTPVAEGNVWQEGDDPDAPCPVARWRTSTSSICEWDASPCPTADAEESPMPGDDEDPASPCPVSRWQAAAASRYCPASAPLPPIGDASPHASAATSFPPSARGGAPPPMVGSPAADGAASLYAAGKALTHGHGIAANASPLPPAGWPSLPRTVALAPLMPVADAGRVSPALETNVVAQRRQRAFQREDSNRLERRCHPARRASGDAPPTASEVGAPAADGGASCLIRGNVLGVAASVSPWPPAGWPAQPGAATVAPQIPGAGWISAQQCAAAVSPQVSLALATRAMAQRCQRGYQREDPNRLECRRHPARQRPVGEHAGPRQPLDERTTIMLRNIPNNYTRDMLHKLIETRGFGVKVDFLYLPIDFHTRSNLGYAFVNLESAEDAQTFWDAFQGFSKWAMRSKKVGSLRWSECQGLEANVNRYRNSPVMTEAVPDRYKPAIYADGSRIEFPAPTKPLRASHIQQVPQK